MDQCSKRCWSIAWSLRVRFHADCFCSLPGQRFCRVFLQVPDNPAGVTAIAAGILHVITKYPYIRPSVPFLTFYGSKLIPCPPHARPPFSVADRAVSFARLSLPWNRPRRLDRHGGSANDGRSQDRGSPRREPYASGYEGESADNLRLPPCSGQAGHPIAGVQAWEVPSCFLFKAWTTRTTTIAAAIISAAPTTVIFIAPA